ncbi:hypothetical protein KIPB_007011 [Kipferlia bialata]|uniref:RIIa domain-containing protein n=1 Tax=Kipferlia bialata TaxID=797122 RepID=A0A9K3CVG0_9EUKA|nr:hypothetical protein KIPB_003735 [Kipferlia bialata]GIQ83241.1 hypothetical protein KIPB_004532 [Kipferlia bialata]GIQ83941.1 hypothetical protein KIPB_005348 [Kipferlia bialata]GIQ85361.1 hypothetical protein KIPB_007011 [Kipferlia bialata]|eukprot:g3735.t1
MSETAETPEVPDDVEERYPVEHVAEYERTQEELEREHAEYLSIHPELRDIITDFVSSVLVAKPDDIYEFALSHFE